MSEELWRVGAHEAHVEPPDVFFVRPVGEVSEEEAVRIIELSEACAAGGGHHFWLIDATQVGHVGPQARRRAASWPVPPWHWCTVVFGAGFAQRILARMLWSATKLLRREVEPVVFFAAEEEARAWIAAERERRTAAAAASMTHPA